MSKKQSSVDYLFDKLWETPKDKINWFNILMDAKGKHESEIIDAFGVGCHHESKRLVGYRDTAQQYYNENFNQ